MPGEPAYVVGERWEKEHTSSGEVGIDFAEEMFGVENSEAKSSFAAKREQFARNALRDVLMDFSGAEAP